MHLTELPVNFCRTVSFLQKNMDHSMKPTAEWSNGAHYKSLACSIKQESDSKNNS